MKRKKAAGIVHWFKDGILKGLVVLLVVTAGFYAYAQISFPPVGPNVTSGVVGQFVGFTQDTFSTPIDYKAANDLCETGSVRVLDSGFNIIVDTNVGAHVCTPDEMVNSYNHGSVASSINNFFDVGDPSTQFAWVNNGPPGFTANANDCLGWSELTNKGKGTKWNMKRKYGSLFDCSAGTAFACCK